LIVQTSTRLLRVIYKSGPRDLRVSSICLIPALKDNYDKTIQQAIIIGNRLGDA
jgi:hypothetical protein